jgi:plasmid stability protein
MTDLILRDLPDDVWAALQARARRRGHAAEEEVMQMILRAAQEEQLLEQLDRATADMAVRLTRTEPLLSPRPRLPRRQRRGNPTPASELNR